MEEFSDDFLVQVKSQLLGLQQELQAQLDLHQGATATVDLDQSKVGRLSRMDAMQQQAMALASKEVAEQHLRQVLSALKRIDSEEFGYCLSCDQPISTARLEIRPESPLCINCQQQSETR